MTVADLPYCCKNLGKANTLGKTACFQSGGIGAYELQWSGDEQFYGLRGIAIAFSVNVYARD